MKRRRIMGALLLVSATLLGACGGSDGMSADAPFDQQFIDMMTPHHEGAIMMAMTAQQRAEHAELKQMATEMIEAQGEEVAELKGWRKQWYGSDITPDMDHMPMLPGMEHEPMMNMTEMNEELKTASPFDKAFIDAMIPHHQMGVDAASIAQKSAEHDEIEQLAAHIIDSQSMEIDQMKSWRAAWYPGE